MADNKVRTKMRKNRLTIDDKYMGPEPVFQPGETKDNERRENLWSKAAHWYNYFYKAKDYVPTVLQFAEDLFGYDKDQLKTLKKLQDWELTGKLGKAAKIHYRGFEYNEKELANYAEDFKVLYEKALVTVEEIKEKSATKVVVTIQQRQKAKILDTIMVEWDEVVEGWLNGKYKQEFDAYKLFKQYGLKGTTLNMFKNTVNLEYQPIKDAYDKTCDQAVEAFAHISKANQKKMLTTMETIFEDLDKLKTATKAARIPRVKKPKTSDVQIKNLKYKVEDIDVKIMSINPVMIPGKEVLFVYNTKTRKLTEYVTESTKGFEVSGTTIKNISDKSRVTTLRKPDDILPLILSKTIKQIDKQVWDTLTTKVSVPNGRINADCILLRVL
jgi:predicted Zn-dependent protease with MMP-like domain